MHTLWFPAPYAVGLPVGQGPYNDVAQPAAPLLPVGETRELQGTEAVVLWRWAVIDQAYESTQ